MRKLQSGKNGIAVEQPQNQNFPPELLAILEEDKASNPGQHSIMDTWLALKAEAERQGYSAHLVLPYDMENLEIEYKDQRGERTRIFTVLYPGGKAHTTQDGLMFFSLPDDISPDIEDPLSLVPGEAVSKNMQDQVNLLRGSIEWHKSKQDELNKTLDTQPHPVLGLEGP